MSEESSHQRAHHSTAALKAATDPRRKVLAQIITAVLRRANFAQAETNSGGRRRGYPRRDARGFWMRVDSIGPGIALIYVGHGSDTQELQKMVGQYQQVLRREFQTILGQDVDKYIVLNGTTEWHTLTVMVPPENQLRRLHATFVKR